MTERSPYSDLEALRDAAAVAGLGARAIDPTSGDETEADLVLVNPAGGAIPIELKRMSLAGGDGLQRRVLDWERRRTAGSTIQVLVADRVTGEARDVLRRSGWSWLDLRGHLHLAGPGLFVDIDIPAFGREVGRSPALSGRAGLEVAAALLLDPDEPATVRPMAESLGRAPSTVSEILSRMRGARLVDEKNRPVIPELFWQLADHWKPAVVDVRTIPVPGDRAVTEALQLNLHAAERTTGWALTDTVAAAAYGAPVAARTDHPLDFYVPNQVIQRRAAKLLGTAAEHGDRAATIRVAPVPMACSQRVDAAPWADEIWPLAQPLFVALDLAQDPGRGREILTGWAPPEPWRRVW